MPNPFFSVVIPVYNRACSVRPTLESVLAQTETDWEVIIVDDGSRDSDALVAVVDSLNDSRFRYIRRENGGGSAARNTGIDAATGRYIAFLDSDDLFLSERLYKAKAVLAGQPDNVVSYSQFWVERGVGKRWVRPEVGPAIGQRIDEYLMCTDGNIQTSTVTIPTQLAQRVRFDERLPSSQDTDFAVRCAHAGARYIFIPEPLVIYMDVHDLTRVSRQKRLQPLLNWINGLRGTVISDKAYFGYRGWHCARIASYTSRLRGLAFYLPSVLRGVYPPAQALRIAGQVLVPQQIYQRIVNMVVAIFGRSQVK